LHFPDFRANERTFQLLTQVAGRTGRGDKSGEVILQTYHPDHPVIRTAARHDYHAFYKTELAERRQLGYPPLASLTKITCRHRLQEKALQIATTIADRMKAKQKTVQVLGPVPAFVPKLHYQYIYLVFIQGAIDRNALRQTRIDGVVDVDPIDLLS
jgi:primosomal protein N' (replication factor Y)